jgi:hypothetical protein
LGSQPFQHLTTISSGCLLAGMKTAKTALVIVDCPKYMDGDKTWTAFLKKMRTYSQTEKSMEQIGVGVWLVRLDKGLLALSRIVESADTAQFPIRALFFKKTPNWTEYPTDAKPSGEVKPS